MTMRPDAGGALTENESIRASQSDATKVGGPVYDRSAELRNFMYAVYRYEGTSWGSKNGAYGFPSGRWKTMAEGAGMRGANMGDKQMQTYVAAFWMDSYYQKYRNWGLVAVAWKSGTGAADAIIKQSRKKPADVSFNDIKDLAPDSVGFVGDVTKWSGWARTKGGVPEDYVPEEGGVQQAGTTTNTVITGSGFNAVEDPYTATIRALYDEAKAEKQARQPSGAEMLFAQLETLSNTVTGGTGRKDWRLDVSEAGAGGVIPQLAAMERPGQPEEEQPDGA